MARFFENLGNRVGGPLTLRLLVPPLVMTVPAIRARIHDARAGRPAGGCGCEGLRDLVVIDVVYQLIVERWVYPGESSGGTNHPRVAEGP